MTTTPTAADQNTTAETRVRNFFRRPAVRRAAFAAGSVLVYLTVREAQGYRMVRPVEDGDGGVLWQDPRGNVFDVERKAQEHPET